MVIVRIIPGLSCPQAEKIRSPASYSPVYPMEPVGKESARCPLVPMPNKSFKALWPPVCPMQPYAAPWRAKNFPVVGSIWSLPEKQPGRWLNALPRCWETASPPAWWSPSTTTARAKSPAARFMKAATPSRTKIPSAAPGPLWIWFRILPQRTPWSFWSRAAALPCLKVPWSPARIWLGLPRICWPAGQTLWR